jgi:Fur family ferric uptake transcriptional regulator
MTVDPLRFSEQRLQQAGYKLTNARRSVLRVFIETERHLTSGEILEAVQKLNPEVGRASVFRALELFTKLSIVRPTYLEPRTPHYIFMPADGHHAHLICTQCQRVVELGDCEIEELVDRLADQHTFHMTGHLLELYGLCDACDDHPQPSDLSS